jgi:hypothetical protein
MEFTFGFIQKGKILKTRFVIDSILTVDFTDSVFWGQKLDLKNPLSSNHLEIDLVFESGTEGTEKIAKLAEFYSMATLHSKVKLQNVPSVLIVGAGASTYSITIDNDTGSCIIHYPLKQQYLEKYFAKFELLLHYPNPFLKKQMQDEIESDLVKWSK